jgi:hypothetical protein
MLWDRPPLRGTKDTHNNVSHKARFISSHLGSRYPPDAAGFNEDPKCRVQAAFIFFLNISHGHTAIFYGPWGHIFLISPTSWWWGKITWRLFIRNLINTRCLNSLTHIPFSKINQKQSLFPEIIPPPFVPVSGSLGHVSHGRFQAEWAASLKGTLTFPPFSCS